MSQHTPTDQDMTFDLRPYNVTWDSPSQDSSGSMPVGNGDIGLNVWAEPSGDLVFYISKIDAWSEIGRLLKIGRVRVRFGAARLDSFEQTLDLETATIHVGLNDVAVKVWVDAHHPAIHIEATGTHPFTVEAGVEVWRTKEREIAGDELFSAYNMLDAPHPVIESGDTLLAASDTDPPDGIVWFHRNPTSVWPETVALQGLAGAVPASSDPLLRRTFGALLSGEAVQRVGAAALRSAQASTHHRLSIHVLTAQTATAGEWLALLNQQAGRVNAIDFDQRRAAHERWWRDFWQRSWIVAAGGAGSGSTLVTQGYTWQRFISACAGRGAQPIKFNGSLFAVDARETGWNGQGWHYDADYRAWGGPYWFQNTRLAYWPMLAAGDYDSMPALFRIYMDALPLLQARTRLYFGHAGAFFPETMDFWGTYANPNYGWDRRGKPASQVDNTYIGRYYSCGLELLALMLDYHAHTQDAAFLRDVLLVWADEILTFYDQHYPHDAHGRLRMEPAQAIETWQSVVNPAPDIAGLRYVLARLAAIAPRGETESRWERLRLALPDLPMRQADGGTPVLDVAEAVLEDAKNSENAELYAVFPFRLFGVHKPGLEMARETFARRRFRHNRGWCQDSIQAACLGLAGEAQRMLVERFSTRHAGSRFPAFWGPNFDWIPDQDHGGAGMLTLQIMLMQCETQCDMQGEMQCEDERIVLFPAWPKDWDVNFKLRAPHDTVVAGCYRQGRLDWIKVDPQARLRDVILMQPG